MDAEGPIDFNVMDDQLAALRKPFNNRLFGLTALDLGQPVPTLVAQIAKAVKEYGLSGVAMEPGNYKDKDGGPLHAVNRTFFPTYETITKLDVSLMHQSGIYACPDYGANYWPRSTG